jgi:hypothetical protein
MGRGRCLLSYAIAIGLGLGGCGSSPPVPPARAVKLESAPPAPEPAAPRVPSPYERRWSSACNEGGALGHCPAPFDRAALFIDVEAQDEDRPPAFCGSANAQADPEARAAIVAKRRSLRACFRGAAPSAWVDLGPDGAPAPAAGPARPVRTVTCVAKIVKQALGTVKTAPDRVVVMNGGAAEGHTDALSKASIDEVIMGHASEVNACYDAALEVWPGLRGRVAPSVVIWFDGSVALVRTGESSFDNPALECCINTAVSGWRFGKPASGAIAIVSLPFRLGPAP